MSFSTQPSKPHFQAIQERMITFWKQYRTFEQSVAQNPADQQYRFYDGPPFITGTPHTGTLTASMLKDVFPRYQTMKGKRVERVWGRDCHGLPIEEKVQKKLGLASNLDIEKVGIQKFIDECYGYTRSTSAEWGWYVDNIGRRVDFNNSYKTMDNDYMESVMWVFKQLRDKGLIYKGKRVSMYSTKLETPISSFEVAMDDTYGEVNDPAITVMFDLSMNGEGYNNVYALARTTTPWTMPCNIALAVNKEKTYVQVRYEDKDFIVAKARQEEIFKGKDIVEIHEISGSALVGLSYQAPFDYFQGKTGNPNDHKIYHADFITDTDGTGIGHEAPEFGEVDFQLAKKVGLTITEAMNNDGTYSAVMQDLSGQFYRDMNDEMIERLRQRGLLFAKSSITHRVAFCPRSGTPLVYKAQDSWFIDIQSLKPRLLELNDQISRYPEHLKHGRFAKSIESAPDRCISRTRYRGTPMPVYMNKNKTIHCMRHAGYDGGVMGGLTNEGKQSIIDIIPQLAQYNYKRILTSSVPRAVQTAEIVSQRLGIPYEIDDALGNVERTSHVLSKKQRYHNKKLIDSDEQELFDILEYSLMQTQQYINHFQDLGDDVLLITHAECIQLLRYLNDPTKGIKHYFAHQIPLTSLEIVSLDAITKVIGSRDELFELNKPFAQMTKLVLVRHGRTDYNDQKLTDHHNKARLTDLGKKQADTLRELCADESIDVIYCSPFARCLETIKPLADLKGKEIITDERLVEFNHGHYQDKQFACELLQWSDEKIGETGEAVTDIYERVRNFVHEVVAKHPGQTVAICTHAGIVQLIGKVVDDYDFNKAEQKAKRTISNKTLEDFRPKMAYVVGRTMKNLDLHRPTIDEILIQDPETKQTLHRIPEVLDCRVESASMPYGQVHYPFENKAKFDASFPADFVVEYTGQIRARFYVMHVLGVALFDKPAFRNVLCTGVMAGNDGRKMSKSYGNFTDPRELFPQYGGDVIRMTIMNTPVVYGGDVALKDEMFVEMMKKALLPLWNAFGFFTTYANIDGREPNVQNIQKDQVEKFANMTLQKPTDLVNFLDRWILSELDTLIQQVDLHLSSYAVHRASDSVLGFLDLLTNWYIRRSRRRFRASEQSLDKQQAYETLYYVLMTLCQVIAPMMPFVSEMIWKSLTAPLFGLSGEEIRSDSRSVHLTSFPEVAGSQADQEVSTMMTKVRSIVSAGLAWRSRRTIRVRQPLSSLTLSVPMDQQYLDIILEELNIKQLLVDESLTSRVQAVCKPHARLLGPKFGKQVQELIVQGKQGNFTTLTDGRVQIGDAVLELGEFEIDYVSSDAQFDGEVVDGLVLSFDATITQELALEGYARDLIRQIQDARKEADYHLADRIQLSLDETLGLAQQFGEMIMEETLSTIVSSLETPDITKTVELGGQMIGFGLKR